MKFLVFGRSGQLARELQNRAGAATLDVYGSDVADFADPKACADIVKASDADAIINAAAYTAVDVAEKEEARATLINGTAPGAIAEAAAERGMPFVHVSTDYVFDGSGESAWKTDAAPGPLGAYGRSKLAGESAIRVAGGPHGILRGSWVVSAHGSNFVKTMLRFAGEYEQLFVVADQVGGPTPAADLADACLSMAAQLCDDPSKSGTYHFAGGPSVSWADFAREIFAQAGLGCKVVDIPTTEYPTPAKRPLNSRLDCSLTDSVFGIAQPDWRIGLTDILSELGAIKR